MKRCHCCNRKYPLWMFHDMPQNWYTRDGLAFCCKLCWFKGDVRYRKGKSTGMFTPLEAYTLTFWERVKELFR